MRRIATLAIFLGFLTPMLASAPAHAQATRTWVSGVGDDANPCSRTAPCKTWAGAISKTAPFGEIDCLDPGGFGAVTITKSMTIDCSETVGSGLVAGTNGIVIAAAATDRVVLRNLRLQGLANSGTTGVVGILINTAAVVSIEHCIVTQFGQQGIKDQRSSGGVKLFIRDTVVSHNVGTGIALTATTGVNNTSIENVMSVNNLFGIATGTSNNATVKHSVFSGNTSAGVEADGGAQLTVDDSNISGNATGVLATSSNIRLSNNDINFNTTNGTSGSPVSYGTNRFLGNAGSTTTTPASQQ